MWALSIKHNSYFSKIATLVLLISPILQEYGWGRYDFAFIATLLLGFIYLINNGWNNKMPRLLTLYILYSVVSIIIYVAGGAHEFPIFTFRVLITFIMFWGVIQLELLIHYYKIIGVICIVYFYLQFLVYTAFGYFLSGVLWFLPIAIADDYGTYYYQITELPDFVRCTSFFSEPASFAQFLLPLLCIELVWDKNKYNYLYSLIIILTLLLLQSGNAMVGLAVVFIFYIIRHYFIKININKLLSFGIIIIPFLIGASIFISTEMGSTLLNRFVEVESSSDVRSSGFLRIYRGYGVYDNFTNIEKITGVYDNSVLRARITSSKVAWAFYNEEDLYFNAMQHILIRTGLVGLIIFISLLFYLWKGNNDCARSILLVLIVFSLVASIYMTETTALCLLLAHKMKLYQQIKKINDKFRVE